MKGVQGDVGDSINRRNEQWVYVCGIAVVIFGDDGNGGRLNCLGISCAPVVLISCILD